MAEPAASIVGIPRAALSILRVHGEPNEPLAALGRRLGLNWPLAPGMADGGTVSVLWLSPRDWLIAGPVLETDVAAALTDVVHHLTDASDQLAGFDLCGPLARDLAAAGCSLDLHLRMFPPGACAVTQLAGLPVVLQALQSPPDLRIYVDVSLAHWLGDWLTDAADGLRP